MTYKKRNIVLVYLFGFITFGIYFIYWFVSTKNQMNSMGAKIPTAWLMIIPLVNLYWIYKYAEGFATIKKDENKILYAVLFIFVGIVTPAIVQIELNKKV
jgi:membrane protein YdbS with pleckstrin-like domain